MVKVNKVKSSFMFLACLLLSLTSTRFIGSEIVNSVSNSFSNINSLNARKWGSLYISFPHLSVYSIFRFTKDFITFSCEEESKFFRVLSSLSSFVIEYKKYIPKSRIFVGVKLNFNNTKLVINTGDCFSKSGYSPFSAIFYLDWIYYVKGNNIFSGSFSPIGFCLFRYNDDNESIISTTFDKEVWPLIFNFGFTFLKYENTKTGFYFSALNTSVHWIFLYALCADKDRKIVFYNCILCPFFFNLLSVEFGFNICRLIDKKKVKTSEL